MKNSLEKLKLLGKMPNEDLDNDSQDVLDLSNKYMNWVYKDIAIPELL